MGEELGGRPTMGPCHMVRRRKDKGHRECHGETREEAVVRWAVGASWAREGCGDGVKWLGLKLLVGAD